MFRSALWNGARPTLDSNQSALITTTGQPHDISAVDSNDSHYPHQLRVFTLGQFEIWLPEHTCPLPLVWSNAQSQLLLKALVGASGQQMTRDQAIELLWPDCDPEWGKTRLRQTLSKLRHALEPNTPAYNRSVYVTSDRTSLRLTIARTGRSKYMWIDFLAFERTAEAAVRMFDLGQDGRTLAYAALDLYRGQFLPLDRYAEWAHTLRQRYHRLWCMLLRRLVYADIAEQQLERALDHLCRLTDSVPDDEDAVFLSMAVHAAVGRRTEALQIYEDLRLRLLASLETAPKLELRALSETIRAGQSVENVLALLTMKRQAVVQ